MPIKLEDILEGTSTDRMQSVGQMQVIPIQGDDDDFFSPPEVNVRTSNYGDVHLENDSDRPTIVPPGAGWVTEQSAQNHAIGGGALVPAGKDRHIDTAMCIQSGQGGYIKKERHPMLVLPAALRDKALQIRSRRSYDKLWSDIETFNGSYNMGRYARGHLEDFLNHFKDELDQFVAEFELVPNQIGAIVLIGGKIVGVERAPSQEFWASVWEPLIRVCYGSMAIKAAQAAVEPPATRAPLSLGRSAKTLGALKTALMKAAESQAKITEKAVSAVKGAALQLAAKPDERMGDNYLTCAKTSSLTGQIVARGTSDMNVVYTSLCATGA